MHFSGIFRSARNRRQYRFQHQDESFLHGQNNGQSGNSPHVPYTRYASAKKEKGRRRRYRSPAIFPACESFVGTNHRSCFIQYAVDEFVAVFSAKVFASSIASLMAAHKAHRCVLTAQATPNTQHSFQPVPAQAGGLECGFIKYIGTRC